MTELDDLLAEDGLAEWLPQQRWFASKTRDVADVELSDVLRLSDDPEVAIGLISARFHAGTHELYQLLLGVEHGRLALDALTSQPHAAVLARLLTAQADCESLRGTISFRWEPSAPRLSATPSVRPMGMEQSNSTVVLDDKVALKAFRRLEAGKNPEQEMLRFLSDRDFPNIAALSGWYELRGDTLSTTLGIAQELIHDGRDGWELALDELASHPDRFLARLHELGEVIGTMHALLGSDGSDPDFAPEPSTPEGMSLLTATIDEDIERIFLRMPDGIDALGPIMGRGEEIRDRLQMMSHAGAGGQLIRHHGDLHLGQTLRTPDRWVILDFEGEPARALTERRRKRSPLRDVAGMLRSFAYVASASALLRGTPVPADWEARARETFLDGYMGRVDINLLPPGHAAITSVLGIYELEKAVYELRYELDNRPDWVPIPVAGIERILGEEIT
jgi:trehalose synthase-fused probable maltokinase